ncbi:isochorismatase family protein [Streptomyces sp. NPDC057445]|uniref:isochorismatase family protein n=1 Tax=Streptomyces sp. NPDC057445 TaxID=3346136 RepID=UPI003692F496
MRAAGGRESAARKRPCRLTCPARRHRGRQAHRRRLPGDRRARHPRGTLRPHPRVRRRRHRSRRRHRPRRRVDRGVATDLGVESTARAAADHGYERDLAEDAMTALTAEEHRAAVELNFPRLGTVAAASGITLGGAVG